MNLGLDDIFNNTVFGVPVEELIPIFEELGNAVNNKLATCGDFTQNGGDEVSEGCEVDIKVALTSGVGGIIPQQKEKQAVSLLIFL